MSCLLQPSAPGAVTTLEIIATSRRPVAATAVAAKRSADTDAETAPKRTKPAAQTPLGALPVALPLPDFSPKLLAALTPHHLDATIKFDEPSHKYYVNWLATPDGDFDGSRTISVSGFVHKYFAHFNADAVVVNMMRSSRWEQSKYHGMSADEIKALWTANGNAASAAGTAFHAAVECHLNGWSFTDDYLATTAVQQWREWHRDVFTASGLVPFRTELRFRSDAALRLTGTADLIAVKADHPPPSKCGGVLELHIIDWKCAKAITRSAYGNKTGSGPCAELPDCNHTHYSLQQNTYKWLLERYYGQWAWRGQKYTSVRVVSMCLVVCHEAHGKHALVVPISDMQPVIEAMVAERRAELLAEEAEAKQCD